MQNPQAWLLLRPRSTFWMQFVAVVFLHGNGFRVALLFCCSPNRIPCPCDSNGCTFSSDQKATSKITRFISTQLKQFHQQNKKQSKMVIVGNFSVRIVNAEDKKPFQEHIGPGRKIFAEVEPDIEYLIEIQVVGGENPDQMYNFSFEVDGQSLGYHCTTNYNSGNSFHGILSRESGIEKLKVS